MIHPTAIIHPKAQLDPGVEVAPYAVIDEHVSLGAGCVVGPHVHLTGHTVIGSHNRFHSGAVIGDAPQDLRYRGEPTRLRIGDHNTFREHVTVNRSNTLAEETIIGSHNLLMGCSHIGHNVVLGDHIIIGNGALLAGHVTVADRAFLSGGALVHQFTRIGTLALMQGGARIGQDLPPFCITAGENMLCGLNTIGLRRNGFTGEQRIELKRLYRALFRSETNFSATLALARAEFKRSEAIILLDFLAASKRGVCRHSRHRDKDPSDE